MSEGFVTFKTPTGEVIGNLPIEKTGVWCRIPAIMSIKIFTCDDDLLMALAKGERVGLFRALNGQVEYQMVDASEVEAKEGEAPPPPKGLTPVDAFVIRNGVRVDD